MNMSRAWDWQSQGRYSLDRIHWANATYIDAIYIDNSVTIVWHPLITVLSNCWLMWRLMCVKQYIYTTFEDEDWRTYCWDKSIRNLLAELIVLQQRTRLRNLTFWTTSSLWIEFVDHIELLLDECSRSRRAVCEDNWFAADVANVKERGS